MAGLSLNHLVAPMPIIHFRKLPPLFFASLGALLGLLITAFVLSERSGQKNRELLQDFGETVVAMAAQEVVESAVQEDLVSMHAVMQSLVAQPRVKMATVHNLEQQLLVQAGQVRNEVEHHIFSAPIALHDSVAGHVSIAMESAFPGDAAVRWTIAGTAFLLSLMVLLTLYETRGVAWYFANKDPGEGEEGDDGYFEAMEPWPVTASRASEMDDRETPSRQDYALDQEDEEEGYYGEAEQNVNDEAVWDRQNNPQQYESQALGEQGEQREYGEPGEYGEPDEDAGEPEPEVPIFQADLVLALPNYNRLQQQLNSDRFAELTRSFDHALHEVLSLYGGRLMAPPHNHNIYCIVFSSQESCSEAAFRAACSAYLVQQKAQQSKIRFNVLAEICPPETDVKLPVNQTGIYFHGIEMDNLLSTRVNSVALDECRHQLVGFNAPFASLLERQERLVAEV